MLINVIYTVSISCDHVVTIQFFLYICDWVVIYCMPKKTFENLDADKRDQFVNGFLREFTLYKYDDASISRVLKQLGLAKGSFYQYFENKQDLFNYLIGITFQAKMSFLQHVQRGEYNSFWEYWREMYAEGLKFDSRHPLMSNFAYRLMDNLNSPTVFDMYAQWQQQGLQTLTQMVEAEIKLGGFRDDIPTETLAMFLMNMGKQIQDALRLKDPKGLQQAVMDGEPLIAGRNEDLFFKIIDDNILLLRSAMDKN